MKNLEMYLDLAKKIAISNGRLMIRYSKKRNSFLKTDKYFNEIVEEKVIKQTSLKIQRSYPTHNFFNTSGNKNVNNKGWEWICDPIDGAFGYSRGFNISVTSVALTFNGQSVLAVVHDPWNRKMFHAIKSQGSYLNNKRIFVNKIPLERQTFINTEWWPKAHYDVENVVHSLSKKTLVYSLHIGSVIQSACLVAEGVFSASIFGGLVHGKNHEAAAVKLIVEEAGGKFTDLQGNSIGYIGDINGFIISNGAIHESLVKAFSPLFT